MPEKGCQHLLSTVALEVYVEQESGILDLSPLVGLCSVVNWRRQSYKIMLQINKWYDSHRKV